MDIELAAETVALIAGSPARGVERQIAAGTAIGLAESDAQALLTAYRLQWRLHAAARLLTDRVLDWQALGEGARAFILRETGAVDGADLSQSLAAAVQAAGAAVSRLVGDGEGKGAGDGSC
jgi:glutamate-ammonia-ligase adenylyltransferase